MNRSEYRIMYREERGHWWYVALHELILTYVPSDRPEQRILDAGCGTGRLLELLRLRGIAEGCDASAIALYYCTQRGVNAVRCDLSSDPLGRDRFDLITSVDVLYHRLIRSEGAVLKKFFAALRPGGRLILQVPAYEWLRSSHDDAVHTNRRYTRREVERLLRACGFLVEKSTYRVTLLSLPIMMIRLVRKSLRPRGGGHAVSSDVKAHSRFANALLLAVMKAENRMLSRMALPFGTSVFAVARKPASSRTGGRDGDA